VVWWAVFVWCAMTVGVCARSAIQGTKGSLFPTWSGAGRDWRAGHDLYEEDNRGDKNRFGYRYSPLMAALLTPWGFVPLGLGNVLWRLFNAGVFLAAVGWWLREGVPHPATATTRGLIYLLVAPLALGSLNNAQVNLILIGLLLMCLTAVSLNRWYVAALCAALAIYLKVYPIAFVLLLALLHPRRFLPRFLLVFALLGALPFLLQDPEYVMRQYGLWWERIRHNDVYRRYWPLREGYRDGWLLVRAWGLPVTLSAYTLLQLGGAAACGLLTVWFRLRLGPGRQLLAVVLLLSCGWMLVLGPAPESATYVLIAPSLAWWLVRSRATGDHLAHYAGVVAYGFLGLCVVGGSSSRGIDLYQVAGLQPLAVLLFLGGVLASRQTYSPATTLEPAEAGLPGSTPEASRVAGQAA
jgi:hypothetical protein